MATSQAAGRIQLARHVYLDSEGEGQSDSDREEEEEETIQEDNSAQGETILLVSEMLKKHQKGDTDSECLAHWVNAPASRTRDELQSSSRFLRVLVDQLQCFGEVDHMLVLREQIDGTNGVIVRTSLIGDLIEETHQGPGTGHEAVKKFTKNLVHS